MGSPICISVLIMLSTILILHKSEACNLPVGWVSKPLETRARQAPNIVYGTVLGIYQGMTPEEYLVEMDMLCVMKGAATRGRANVTEIGSDCVDNAMRKGVSYILFVQTLRAGNGQNRYVTHDVNTEMAAHRATKENFDVIRRSGVSNQCNQVTTYQPAVDPDAPIFTGTGNGTDAGCMEPPCNAGNVLVAGILWMLSALVYTVATN